MTRTHRIALDPTVAQRKYFAQAAGTARFTWNWALAEWNSQYDAGGQPKANELKRFWNSIKYERFPWLRKVHRDAHAQPFANLQAAWTTYFQSLKNGVKAGRPKFKNKGKARDSFYVANDKLNFEERSFRAAAIESSAEEATKAWPLVLAKVTWIEEQAGSGHETRAATSTRQERAARLHSQAFSAAFDALSDVDQALIEADAFSRGISIRTAMEEGLEREYESPEDRSGK